MSGVDRMKPSPEQQDAARRKHQEQRAVRGPEPQVDVLGNIERVPDDAMRAAEQAASPTMSYRASARRAVIAAAPLIREPLERQLAGAVDALRWALGFIEYQGEPSPLDDPREGHEDAESHRRAQAIVGGQSS